MAWQNTWSICWPDFSRSVALTAIRAGKDHALERSRLALGGAIQVRRIQVAKGEEKVPDAVWLRL